MNATIHKSGGEKLEAGKGGMHVVRTQGTDQALEIGPHELRALLTMLGDRPTSLHFHLDADRVSAMCEKFIKAPDEGLELAFDMMSLPKADYVSLAKALKRMADASTADSSARYPYNQRLVRFE